MIPDEQILVRQALLTDRQKISSLILSSPTVHRHLDWRNPIEWIGSTPFYVIERGGEIIAALGCPPDPSHIAWIRLFINSGKITVQESWQILWNRVRADLATKKTNKYIVAAIVLQEWLNQLLLDSGFTSHQSIVMLERDGGIPQETKLSPGILLRAMMTYDLPKVAEVDASAFDELWQNSLTALERAYPQAVWATVAEKAGQVVGYQLSTRNSLGVHLARLAVEPALQRNGLGNALVVDLIQKTGQHGISHLTVNTQSDNATSLALYRRLGFNETGERYPVYKMDIQ